MTAPKSRAQKVMDEIGAEFRTREVSDAWDFELKRIFDAIAKDTLEREKWRGPLYNVQGMRLTEEGRLDASLSGQSLFRGPCYIVPATDEER